MPAPTEIFVDGYYYLPFWIIQQFLDINPPDPFVKCKVVRLTQDHISGEAGTELLDTCDIELPTGTAQGVPRSYLICKHELKEWAQKFAEWFLSFAETESNM